MGEVDHPELLFVVDHDVELVEVGVDEAVGGEAFDEVDEEVVDDTGLVQFPETLPGYPTG